MADIFTPEPRLYPESSLSEYLDAKVDESFVGVIQRLGKGDDFTDDPEYEPLKDPRVAKGGPFYKMRSYFAHVGSEAEFDYVAKRLEEKAYTANVIQNRQADYGLGFATDVALSPETYVPLVGPWVRAAKWQHRALAGSSAALAATMPFEALRMSDDPDRTVQETALSLGTMFLAGGTVATVFGRGRIAPDQANTGGSIIPTTVDEAVDLSVVPKSMGAAAADSPLTRAALADQEKLIPTGIGIENLPLNPLLRGLNSGDPFTVDITTRLVETGGMMLKKVEEQIPMNVPITTIFRSQYLPTLAKSINKAEDAFLRYRGIVTNPTKMTGQAFESMALKAKDFASKNGERVEFDRRLARGLDYNRDLIDDAMTPYVNDAIAAYREVLDLAGNRAFNAGVFKSAIDKKIARLEELGAGREKIANLEAKRDDLMRNGFQAGRKNEGYYPRVYDVDYLLTQEGKRHWLRVVGGRIGRQPAEDAWKRITNSYSDTVEGMDLFLDDVAASGAQARMLDVENDLIFDFLDHNVEAVVRDYVRRMGIDTELTRAFGSVDMGDVIRNLPTQQARKDITAMRDILRGTYGRPADPLSHFNRGVGLIKNYSPLLYMGSATISSLTDIARPIMTEGLNAFFGTGMQLFRNRNAEILQRLNRRTIQEVGEALEMTLSMRSFAMADIGNGFGVMSRMEKTVRNMNTPFFLLNGLNVWNTAMKEFSGFIISQRMNKAINKNWQSLSKADRNRLLSTGIDGPMAGRIQRMLANRDMNDYLDGNIFPKLGSWTDTGAADAYKYALNQQINRTIVTPDVGDRALWTQSHVGSMIAQFKSFGQSSTMRVLISGLQERDKNFYLGAAVMTGIGLLVNDIKAIQYGIDNSNDNWGQTLAKAVDRAGLLAVFSDFNKAVEVASSNRVSLDAVMGGPQTYTSPKQIMSTFGGPGVGAAYDIGNMAAEIFQGNAFSDSFNNSLKRVTPYQSHPLFPM